MFYKKKVKAALTIHSAFLCMNYMKQWKQQQQQNSFCLNEIISLNYDSSENSLKFSENQERKKLANFRRKVSIVNFHSEKTFQQNIDSAF